MLSPRRVAAELGVTTALVAATRRSLPRSVLNSHFVRAFIGNVDESYTELAKVCRKESILGGRLAM